ncbi:hypothetical protein E1281_12970 [Actinomadura sp. KC345]|uniref:DUF5919 domain-containing protein n=1 Tax=Actinomadura sp. KC345 TaxID=2530371 RepID=UPI001045FE16|nr:DUF5919 domain-containing protein [Actinomadura sp. KC345]TDC55346.1 hypothetical protein E1281_12970 [Actinomadura sp. KC345]
MSPQPILLQVVIRQHRLQRYGMFCAAYNKAAKLVSPELIDTAPSRAQLHRWTSGGLKRLPYVDHCRVLEAMFPEWTADELFAPCPPHVLADESDAYATSGERADLESTADRIGPNTYADVTAVFTTRAEFSFAHPPHALLDGASSIRAAGLSLNMLCQQYPDQRLHRLIEDGTTLQALFLDPEGKAIRAREQEEGYTDNHLTTLTRLNIEVLTRLRKRLTPEAQDRLSVAVYDETIRFNITLLNDQLCVMQPYLPNARGLDSPTFLAERNSTGSGLYGTFEGIFTALWERGRTV